MQKVLEAKAVGYGRLLSICGERKDLAPSLLIIEKLPELVAEQVKAIQNLKIDKITVWDSGAGRTGNGTTGLPGVRHASAQRSPPAVRAGDAGDTPGP